MMPFEVPNFDSPDDRTLELGIVEFHAKLRFSQRRLMFPTATPDTRMNGKAKQWKRDEAAFFAHKLFGYKMIPLDDVP